MFFIIGLPPAVPAISRLIYWRRSSLPGHPRSMARTGDLGIGSIVSIVAFFISARLFIVAARPGACDDVTGTVWAATRRNSWRMVWGYSLSASIAIGGGIAFMMFSSDQDRVVIAAV
jgi:hypothetical protein